MSNIAVITQNWNSTGAGTSIDCTIGSPGPAAIVWFGVLFLSSGSIASIGSDRGATYQLIGSVTDSTAGWTVAQYAALGVPAGAERLIVNFTASVAASSVHAVSLSNGQLVLPTGSNFAGQNQASPGTGTGAVSSGNVTPSGQPGMLMGLAVPTGGGNTSCTADTGAGFTSTQASNFAANNSTKYWAMENKRLTSTSAVPATFTIGSDQRMITVAAYFLEVSSGAPIQARSLSSSLAEIGRTGTNLFRTASGLLMPRERKIFLPNAA